ncbi:MAG: 30S ribosomal protein S21 [Patescibacteria group bacterium]|nr:30S ribosomal protein S21 [Patescibacteria group bacterium]MBU1870823.1 30S ribosomal protein S21 [Patescibacteria group bacterium]
MVEFKRKKGESFESFLRRFNKRLQQSGKLKQARSAQHVQPKINKAQTKKRALIGKKLGAKREYLKKIGKLKDEPRRRW